MRKEVLERGGKYGEEKVGILFFYVLSLWGDYTI
jgi:hypothetical protein